ncbi:hypothetical protein AB0K60_22885 [Thermopolyspora sp. NPDC052614]|uniref:hypothetical protein n=1 Tax=Thermopolyspora sp. NPDC052614 TaxID=3155682 RepID=UPI00341E7898
MNISPDDAARALADVKHTQHTALRSAPPMFPSWYLGAVWIVVTGIQFATEVLSGPAAVIGVIVALIALFASVIKFIRDVNTMSLRPHRSIVDPWAWVGFSAWLIATIGLSFALLAAFIAVGFPYPRTGCTLLTAVVVLFTAPWLPRWMTMRTARRLATPQTTTGPVDTEPAAQ